MSAANPVHRGLTPSFVESASKTIGELYESPVNITLSGFGLLNDLEGSSTVAIQLSTERGYEGQTVVKELQLKTSGGFGEIIPPKLNNIMINDQDLQGFDPNVFEYNRIFYIDENVELNISASSDSSNVISYQQLNKTTYFIKVKGAGGEALYTLNIERKGAPQKLYTETFEQLFNDGGFMSKTFVGDNGIRWNLKTAKYSKHQRTGGGVFIQGGYIESEYIGTGISEFSVSLMNKYMDEGDSAVASLFINDKLLATNIDKSENEVYTFKVDSINIKEPFMLKLINDSNNIKSLVIDNISWVPYPRITTYIKQNYTNNTQIYPNPFVNELTFSSETIFKQIELFTISGKKLLSFVYQQKQSVHIDLNLPSGMYILRLIGNDVSETHKIFKI